MEYLKPFVIAEIGCNHKGDMDIAKRLIRTAAIYCEVDAVKFQKRCNRELLTPEQYNAPHPNPANSYGKTYGEHREFLEFTVEQHRELKEYCEEMNIVYSTSVWDLTSDVLMLRESVCVKLLLATSARSSGVCFAAVLPRFSRIRSKITIVSLTE